MKIMILSDLHHEFWSKIRRDDAPSLEVFPNIQRDLTILAGDIASMNSIGFVLGEFALQSPVMYIPGNHEYYGREYHSFNEYIERCIDQLNKDGFRHPVFGGPMFSTSFGGYRFIGATLWTNFGGDYPAAEYVAQRTIYDFEVISVGDNKITPAVMREFHKEHLSFISNQVDESAEPTVVVSHFVPTMAYIQDKWKQDYNSVLLNHYFCNSLDHMMEGPKAPKLWVCGHTHDGFEAQHLETRLVCNPKGYPNENFDGVHMNYQPLVIELE